MLAAGARHALDDEAIARARQAGDIHLDPVDEAQAARTLMVRVCLGNGIGESRIPRFEPSAAHQVQREPGRGEGIGQRPDLVEHRLEASGDHPADAT